MIHVLARTHEHEHCRPSALISANFWFQTRFSPKPGSTWGKGYQIGHHQIVAYLNIWLFSRSGCHNWHTLVVLLLVNVVMASEEFPTTATTHAEMGVFGEGVSLSVIL